MKLSDRMGRKSLASEQRWLRYAPSANARSLAILRIVTCIPALWIARGWVRSDWQLIPEELWYPPRGTGWAIGLVPISSDLIRAMSVVFLVAVLFVLVGYRARLAAAIAVVAGVYVGWTPHFVGKVDHSHHILWFLALLAVSPCADALALRRNRTKRPPEAYALPALAGVLILGVIYLSAGVPKFQIGLDWALSDNMRNLMWNQWWEKQYLPPVPVDQWPVVYKAMGLGAMVFEVLFIPLALYPATRRWIRWIGLVFHFAIWALLSINFWHMAIFYVVLFDWNKRSVEASEEPASVSLAPLILVVVVTVGAFTIPAGWPLSRYPSFAAIAEPIYVDYELISGDGSVLVTRSSLARRHGPQRARPMAAAAIGTPREDVLLAYVSELDGESPGYYQEIRRFEVSTVPIRDP